MSFRASLGVFFGCQFGTASKLFAAADKGSFTEVSEILNARPQLAAYTGFNNSFSALHRAAATGHVEVCRAIIEPIKKRIQHAEAAVSAGRKKQTLLKKMAEFAEYGAESTDQQEYDSPDAGLHPAVAAFLLREGADPLACDWVHMRTCLHYAAMSGQIDCLRLLCSVNTEVAAKDGVRALRDVVVQDIQVDTCRFIDQRAFGGLTALHFAVVTGNLEAVQALLRGGASIMVKTDGEAYIGDEYLVPGSSPLHIAVIIGNLSIVHAILQAHMESMNVVGQGLDERGRRPWEGSSRTDIRSMRNVFRRLPFHLARERGLQQLMSLVDPRIPVDVALDAARDTEHGIGPKRLSTIVSLVLQQSLLQWLDDCQAQLEKEALHHSPASPAPTTVLAGSRTQTPRSAGVEVEASIAGALLAAEQPGPAAARVGRPPLPRSTSRHPSLPSPSHDPSPALEDATSEGMQGRNSGATTSSEAASSTCGAGAHEGPQMDAPTAEGRAQPAASRPEATKTPFAAAAAVPPLSLDAIDPSAVSQSAPVTPSTGFLPREASAPPGSLPNPPPLQAAPGERTGEGAALQHMPSLHGYMGMLSVRRQRTRSLDPLPVPPLTVLCSNSAQHAAEPHPSTASRSTLNRQLSSPANMSSPREVEPGPLTAVRSNSLSRNRQASEQALADDGSNRNVTVVSGRRNSLQGNAPTIRGVLTSIRDRLRSTDSLPVMTPVDEMEKGLSGDVVPPSPVKSEAETEVEDVECGICLDQKVDVAFAGCEHSLCLECARNLTKQEKKPPVCPFCRRMIVGFMRVSPSRQPHHVRSA